MIGTQRAKILEITPPKNKYLLTNQKPLKRKVNIDDG